MSCAYHRDEDFRIVKQRDDLVSAFRYAVMMRPQRQVTARLSRRAWLTHQASVRAIRPQQSQHPICDRVAKPSGRGY